jgi:hypothetical protein
MECQGQKAGMAVELEARGKQTFDLADPIGRFAPSHANSVLAVKDDVVRMAVLFLVVVRLERDRRFDSEGFELAGEDLVFRLRELVDD